MENLWSRFDSIAKPEEVMEAKSQFEPIGEGTYKVLLEEISPSESKSGLPMLKGKFRIIDNNRIIFYNQMLQNLNYPNMTAVNVAEAVSFVSGLVQEEIDFTGLESFAQLITEIPIGTQHTVEVSYGKNDTEKSFPKLKVIEDIDDLEIEDTELDDSIPF